MNAGCVVPVTLTFETPSSCSITGTIALFAIAASVDSGYLLDTSASEMTTGSLGFATRSVGGVIVDGSCRCACCTAFSTFAMFSVSVDCVENAALMLT